jgi:hypothetical protein
VNDQHSGCAPAYPFFELVGPAAVVGERFAVEKVIVVGGRLVDNREQDFSFDIDAVEIMPLILGRVDAVAHEDDGSVQVHAGRTGLIFDDKVFAVLQLDGGSLGGDKGKAGLVDVGVHGHERDSLEISAVLARGFCSG